MLCFIEISLKTAATVALTVRQGLRKPDQDADVAGDYDEQRNEEGAGEVPEHHLAVAAAVIGTQQDSLLGEVCVYSV